MYSFMENWADLIQKRFEEWIREESTEWLKKQYIKWKLKPNLITNKQEIQQLIQ